VVLHFFLVLLDCLISLAFVVGMFFHIVEDQFTTLNDKVIECIIGIGLSTIALLYAFFDGVRFLDSRLDRALYLISCIL
jgi:uncharacterized membrane protein